MSLFVCSECRCIENTALSHFWFRPERDTALCSDCDPEINQWHGRFEKRPYTGKEPVAWVDGVWLDERGE
jgi:hypothetical protein